MYFTSGLIFLLIVLDIIVYYLQKQHEGDQQQTSSLSSSLDQGNIPNEYYGEKKDSVDQPFRRFSVAEIKLATHDFDDAFIIGKGGFGEVYKATINSRDVAIKRAKLDSNQGAIEFWAEIQMLSTFRHSHIVSLLGYCEEPGTKEMILVYEYMPNGSLEDHLHKKGANSCPLTWLQRIHICIGAARGLDYLHTGTSVQHRVIHRDVKGSNILLDENMAAKISDFGLSRTSPAYDSSTTHVYTDHIKGTFGYMDEEYLLTRRVTRKSDVYAFGVVLFQVLCGRAAVDLTLEEEQHGLAGWAKHCVQVGTIDQIVDPCLRGQLSTHCLKEFSQIAYKCLLRCPKDRPTMAEVVARLEFVSTMTLQQHDGVKYVKKAWSFLSIKIPGVHTKNYKNKQKGSNDRKNEPPAIPRNAATTVGKVTSEGKDNNISKNEPSAIPRNAATTMGEVTSEGKENNISIMDPVNAAADHAAAMLKVHPSSSQIGSYNLKIFTFDELKRAARNFRPSAMLGFSDCESTYKGWVDASSYAPSTPGVGIAVAIKLSNIDNVQSLKEWQAEVKRGQFSHPNLVRLLGYCSEDRMLCLVYQHIPSTNLVNRLRGHPLQWDMTMKTAIGTARGLTFLHNAEKTPAYRTFNASNVLINVVFKVQLYFGSATLNQEPGVLPALMRDSVISCYTPPEYQATEQWSVKSDIYAFGVMMLNMIAGSSFHNHYVGFSAQNLMEWAKPILSCNKKLRRTMDPWLEQGDPPKGASKIAELILSCLDIDPENRPPMELVLASLEGINAIEM